MKCQTVLVSSRNDFADVILVTEILVPGIDSSLDDIWIGDYPYLNRKRFMKFTNYANKLLSKDVPSDSNSDYTVRKK